MQRVVINMRNYLMCQAIEQTLKNGGDFYTIVVQQPKDIVEDCVTLAPDMLLMEVAENSFWSLSERMKIRDSVKEENPDCKIVLIVDENAEKAAAEKVKQAKKDGLIDQFIYGSISSTYLTALIDTL